MDQRSNPTFLPADHGQTGKLRSIRRSLARRKTPYDRPASARHASKPAPLASDMAARLLGSASRMLSSSASYLLSYIFKPPPASPRLTPDDDATPGSKVKQDSWEFSHPIQAEKSDIDTTRGLPTTTVSEKERRKAQLLKVEEIIKRRTLTREEFSRLTELLGAKVVDDCFEDKLQLEVKRDAGKADLLDDIPENDSLQLEFQRIQKQHRKELEKDKGLLRDPCLPIIAVTPYQKTSDNGSSSPVEVARAFMSERSRRFAGREIFTPSQEYQEQQQMKMHDMWQQYGGVAEDRCCTLHAGNTRKQFPQTWGTPYPRSSLHFVEPAVQQLTTAPISVTSRGEKLKRSSSVLDGGCNAVEPSRRTRLKLSISAASSNIANTHVMGSFEKNMSNPVTVTSGPNFNNPNNLLIERENQGHLSEMNEHKKDAFLPLDLVPMQSRRTAQKILDALEKLAPTKGKSMGDEITSVRGTSSDGITNSSVDGHVHNNSLQIEFSQFWDSNPFSRKHGGNLYAGIPRRSIRERMNTEGNENFSSLVFKVKGDSDKNYGSLPPKNDETTKEFSFVATPHFSLHAGKKDVPAEELGSISQEAASHGEVKSSTKGLILTSSKLGPICTTEYPNSGGKSNLPRADFFGKGNNNICVSSPESTTDSTVASFTFPSSMPGILFEPPTPKPFFSFSSFAATSSSESQLLPGKNPQYQIFTAGKVERLEMPPPEQISFSSFTSTNGKEFQLLPGTSSHGNAPCYRFGTTGNVEGVVFSFTGSMISSEQAARKLQFLFRHESKPELAFSNAAAATTSCTLISSCDQPFSFVSKVNTLQTESSFLNCSTFPAVSSCCTEPSQEKLHLQSDLIGIHTSVSSYQGIKLQKPFLTGSDWVAGKQSSESSGKCNGSSSEAFSSFVATTTSCETLKTAPTSLFAETPQLPLVGHTSVFRGTASSSSPFIVGTMSSCAALSCSSGHGNFTYESSSRPLLGSFISKPFFATGDSTSQTASGLKPLFTPGFGLTTTAFAPGIFVDKHITMVENMTEGSSNVTWNTTLQPQLSLSASKSSTGCIYGGHSSSVIRQPVFTFESLATTEKPLSKSSVQSGLGNNLIPSSSAHAKLAPLTLNQEGGHSADITSGDRSSRRFIKARTLDEKGN